VTTRPAPARAPAPRPARARPRGGLGRASGVTAVGTAASRASGLLRTGMVAAAIGSTGSLADVYSVANTAPNALYDLLLGGVLTSVVVPVLVQAAREDEDEGASFARALLAVTSVALAGAALVAVLAAPLVVSLYSGFTGAERAKAIVLVRFFLPQIVFYGVTAVAGAVLNTRGRFGAATAVPVLNNLVVIATAALFISLPGPPRPAAASVTSAQTLVLAIGTTLGVAVMAVALLPALRAAGVTPRAPRRRTTGSAVPGAGRAGAVVDPRTVARLRAAASLAGWTVVYVAVTQLGFVVVTHLATARSVRGNATYTNAYQLLQLPYALVGVSVVTALMPALARHHVDERPDLLRAEVSRGLRLAGVLVVPAAVGLAATAGPLARLAFGHGASTVAGAVLIGQVVAVFAVGLVPFTVQQVLLRTLYAQRDSRAAAGVGAVTVAVLVLVDVAVSAVQTGPRRVLGLAAGFDAAYLVGACLAAAVVLHRLDGRGRRVLRVYIRAGVAALLAGGACWLVVTVADDLLGKGTWSALVAICLGGGLGIGVYATAARAMRIAELAPVRRAVAGTLTRVTHRR